MSDKLPSVGLPSWREFASRLVEGAKEKCEWAGFPIPVKGLRLTIAEGYPFKEAIEHFQFGPSLHVDTTETCKEEFDYPVNQFYSTVKGTDVVVIRKPNGHSTYGIVHKNRVVMWFNTLDASFVWPVEAETKAMTKLLELIGAHRFQMYVLTGTFLETSKRSGIVYMFRKLRPTIAITPHHPDGDLRVLCGLCLHPLGYYQESHAGAMVPTDDVIAHLVLMRGDEHRLWKQATQHAPYRHECGL